MTLESGPASGERNYWLFVAVLCLGFAGWFVYDGTVGYPANNRTEAEIWAQGRKVTLPEKLAESPTQPEVEAIRTADSMTVEELSEKFGEPVHVDEERREYYASAYGLAIITTREGRVATATWARDWYKSKKDIEEQFWVAGIPALLGLYGLFKVYRAVTLRATVDDDGLIYNGRRIAFDAMTDLRDYNRKGWVDLYFKDDDDEEEKLRLDNQKVDKFEEIAAVICEVKGFKNPLPAAEDATDDDEPGEEPEQDAEPSVDSPESDTTGDSGKSD